MYSRICLRIWAKCNFHPPRIIRSIKHRIPCTFLFQHQSSQLLLTMVLCYARNAIFSLLLLVCITSIPYVAAASAAVCSQLPYDLLLPLSKYPPAESFCTSFFPQQCTSTVSVTNVLTSTVVVRTTVATTPSTISKFLNTLTTQTDMSSGTLTSTTTLSTATDIIITGTSSCKPVCHTNAVTASTDKILLATTTTGTETLTSYTGTSTVVTSTAVATEPSTISKSLVPWRTQSDSRSGTITFTTTLSTATDTTVVGTLDCELLLLPNCDAADVDNMLSNHDYWNRNADTLYWYNHVGQLYDYSHGRCCARIGQKASPWPVFLEEHIFQYIDEKHFE